jgi:hypothetical protein
MNDRNLFIGPVTEKSHHGCRYLGESILGEGKQRLLYRPARDIEEFTINKVDRLAKGLKNSLLATKCRTKTECRVGKLAKMLCFFLRKDQGKRINLCCMAREATDGLAINPAPYQPQIGLKAER